MSSLSKRSLICASVLVAATAAGTVAAASASAQWSAHTYQNVSTAIPAAADEPATDLSSKVYRLSSGPVRGSAVATASVTCDSCSADAVTMQVLYARNVKTIRVNNVAAAWSACTGCHGSALSLQVVIARSARQVVANNRSLAVNTACVGCQTAAAAVQIVLVSPKQNHLSPSVISSLIALRRQLHDQLLAELSSPPPAAQARVQSRAAMPDPVDQTVMAMQQLLASDLHATSASHDLQVHQGQ